MKFFLTLKHWQLFGLLIGVPMMLQFVAMGLMIASSDPTAMVVMMPILMVIYIGLFFGWFYSLGKNLHQKLPASAPMNLTRFKMFLVIPIAYMLFLSIFMFGMMARLTKGAEPNPAIFALIIPLHLFSMFCIFYCLYFNAKAFKAVELQRPVVFGDYAGEFFLLWFFPIGVWILQPRINKLFDTTPGFDDNQILDSNY